MMQRIAYTLARNGKQATLQLPAGWPVVAAAADPVACCSGKAFSTFGSTIPCNLTIGLTSNSTSAAPAQAHAAWQGDWAAKLALSSMQGIAHSMGGRQAQRQGICGRSFCSDLRTVHPELTEQQYHHEADKVLDLLHEKLEAYVEDLDLDDSDVEFAQGVLNVRLGKLGTYVINKQTPNRQIWLSSPVSGPFRFDCQSGHWVYIRNNQDLLQQLERELKQLTGADIKLAA